MSTIANQIATYFTDRRSRRKLSSYTSAYSVDAFSIKTVSLLPSQSETVVFSNLFTAFFPRPTLIRIGNTNGTLDVTVDGAFCIPMAGSIVIINPSGSTIVEPLVVSYTAG